MPLVLLVLFATVATFISYKTEALKTSHAVYREVGQFAPSAPAGQQLSTNYKYLDLSVSESVNDISEDIMDIVNVDEVLLRTCRTIHVLALKNNCPGKNLESNIWKFLGTANVSKGTLSSALLGVGTTVPAFTCSNMDKFGKALILSALPRDFIDNPNKIFKYDLTGMQDTDVSDPCGYTDIAAL